MTGPEPRPAAKGIALATGSDLRPAAKSVAVLTGSEPPRGAKGVALVTGSAVHRPVRPDSGFLGAAVTVLHSLRCESSVVRGGLRP